MPPIAMDVVATPFGIPLLTGVQFAPESLKMPPLLLASPSLPVVP